MRDKYLLLPFHTSSGRVWGTVISYMQTEEMNSCSWSNVCLPKFSSEFVSANKELYLNPLEERIALFKGYLCPEDLAHKAHNCRQYDLKWEG